MKRWVTLALLAALVAGGGIAPARAAQAPPRVPDRGCEPGSLLDLRARILEILDHGDSARVIVEVTLDAAVDVRSARIRGVGATRLLGDDAGGRLGRRSDGSLTDLRRTARLAPERIVRYPVDLEKGVVHHLLFEAEVETSAGDPITARAHVTVNLDPEQQAEHLPGLVQYRARSPR